MKMQKYLLTVLVVLFYNLNHFSQCYNNPYIINSIVGDTLTKTERDNYLLFPEIDEFNWAVFYLKHDSLLDAQVNYNIGGRERDTIIENYKKLKTLDYHIRAKYSLDHQILGSKKK